MASEDPRKFFTALAALLLSALCFAKAGSSCNNPPKVVPQKVKNATLVLERVEFITWDHVDEEGACKLHYRLDPPGQLKGIPNAPTHYIDPSSYNVHCMEPARTITLGVGINPETSGFLTWVNP